MTSAVDTFCQFSTIGLIIAVGCYYFLHKPVIDKLSHELREASSNLATAKNNETSVTYELNQEKESSRNYKKKNENKLKDYQSEIESLRAKNDGLENKVSEAEKQTRRAKSLHDINEEQINGYELDIKTLRSENETLVVNNKKLTTDVVKQSQASETVIAALRVQIKELTLQIAQLSTSALEASSNAGSANNLAKGNKKKDNSQNPVKSIYNNSNSSNGDGSKIGGGSGSKEEKSKEKKPKEEKQNDSAKSIHNNSNSSNGDGSKIGGGSESNVKEAHCREFIIGMCKTIGDRCNDGLHILCTKEECKPYRKYNCNHGHPIDPDGW